MILDEQEQYAALDDWFKTPQGICVAEAFVSELDRVKDNFSGYNLLQLGSCGENRWLSALNFREKWLVSPVVDTQSATLISSMNTLSIDRNSLDCIIAPLTMEMFAGNKHPMDEIDRVLKPMGYVVFLGINPASLWGLVMMSKRLSCISTANITLRSSLTLKHACLSRGYRQCFLRSFYYIPPIRHKWMIQKLEFLNEMGKMIWPYPAGFYCFIVQKYDTCLPTVVPHRSDFYFGLS